MKHILFIGYAVDKVTAASLSGVSVAGNNMQINLLSALNNISDLKISSLTIYPLASYPQCHRIIIRSKWIKLFNKVISRRVGYFNVPVFKQITTAYSIYQSARKIIKTQDIDTLLTFNLFPQIGLPGVLLKRTHGIELVTLLADLPIDDANKRNIMSAFLRKYFDKFTTLALLKVDKSIVLNKNAAGIYSPQAKYMVMEGGIDGKIDAASFKYQEPNIKNIVYTGALTQYSGILNLIEALQLVPCKDAVLDIYGSGDIKDIVSEKADKYPNIRFHGSISNQEAKRVQRNAFLLVNPRDPNNPISRVTFPSKIFEYMLSGTPVLCTKLDGIPQSYYLHMYECLDNSPETLARNISIILATPPQKLAEKSKGAYEYIIENKSWNKQGERVYKFLFGEGHAANSKRILK